MQIPFVFVTHSAGKLEEARQILGQIDHADIELPEIQSVDVEEVVITKAEKAFEILGRPVIVEDAGLYIQSWNGLPGALVKWFVEYATINGICQMLNNFSDRKAWAKTVVVAYDGVSKPAIFIGRVDGQIALAPMGKNGFGWDKIFIPNGSIKSFGEMSAEKKANTL